ncbi:MAG: RNA degradosome polyphosphate kinase, partial [Vulcanococcus sp.]
FISALIRAAENGKQVMALVELKARFDEDNNIQWARQLERSGVHVVYGVMGLKTHTKLILVMRQERTGLRGYVHVGTGNYNSKTATLYTDLGLLSCRQNLIDDAIELFNSLTGYSKQHEYRSLLVAPGSLRQRMQELIQRETEHAQAGRPAAIRAKMNALVDPTIIALLYEASKAGVQIDLVVRGICSLRPGLAGVSETIRVRSIIDRFLEHSRLFWFSNAGAAEIYLGSADWMERNLDRRVEAVVPVEDPGLRCQLEHLLKLYLEDNSSAWQMDGTGRYERCRSAGIERRAQDELMATWPDMLQR